MVKYDYNWKAVFSDDTELEQFNGEDEVLFSEVEKDMDKLSKFYLISDDGLEEYVVDFDSSEVISPSGSQSVKGDNPKLVYFRRNIVRGEVGTGRILDSRQIFFLGLETDDDRVVLEIAPQLLMSPKKVIMEIVEKSKSLEAVKQDITSQVEISRVSKLEAFEQEVGEKK